MAIASMTGFGRAEGASNAWTWSWEARSVNGRGLDIRCRLPHGTEELEAELRSRAAKYFSRGNITINLKVSTLSPEIQYRVNEAFLADLLKIARSLAADGAGPAAPQPETLLAVRGVVEPVENQRESILAGASGDHIIEGAEHAFTDLAQARKKEGARLGMALDDQVANMERLCAAATGLTDDRPKKYKERFQAQLAVLLDGGPAIPEERIAQEVAIMAMKLDVREELDRLGVHLASVKTLLSEGGAVGRRLDFLCQEINREANTICSKSADVELTQIGLDLKTSLDQFREQIQNVE